MLENRLSPPLLLKRATVSDAGVFTGYASTFNGPVDSYGDVIATGAFTKSLDEHQQGGSTPAMLWSHSLDDPIGKWLQLEQDAHGLKVVGKLTLATTRGKDAYALVKDRALALSIGFSINKDGAKRDVDSRIRTLTDLKLHEISLVAMPANPAARIDGVKSTRDFERVLRDELGYSARQAKRLASGGWPAIADRDVRNDEGQLLEVVQELATRTAELEKLLKR